MATPSHTSHAPLPGEELVEQGLQDLTAGEQTEAALVLQIAAPRLKTLGVNIPASKGAGVISPEHQLYALLSTRPDAHSRYNALLARIASYARAAEHATAR